MGVCSSNQKTKAELIEEKRVQRAQAFKDIAPPVKAEANLEAIKHNIKLLKENCNPIAITLSKDAYGCGAVEVAKLAVAEDLDTFIVSSMKEGIEVREGGITPQHGRVLVFGEPAKVELSGYSAFGLGILVTCRRSADMIREWSKLYKGKKKLMAYILVDAGYTGIGVPSKEVQKCVSHLRKSDKVSFQGLVVRTTDDRIDLEHPRIDLDQIYDVVSALRKKDIKINRMIFENCPSLLHDWNKMARDFGKTFRKETTFYARCSLETFGFGNAHLNIETLRHCLSLKAQVRDVRKVAVGEWIGLNGGWQAAFESFVAVVSCGYSHGYPHFMNHQQNLAHVRINGLSYSIIGEICSDHIFVLLGSTDKDPPAKVGDFVTLFGPVSEERGNMDFLELCELAELSPTQVLCHVSACAAKCWKSTKITRRNTLTKMVPKDLKEVKREADKEIKEQKKTNKAKKGSKKKDEKRKSKRGSKRKSVSKGSDRPNKRRSTKEKPNKRRSMIKSTGKTPSPEKKSKRRSMTKAASKSLSKERSKTASKSPIKQRSRTASKSPMKLRLPSPSIQPGSPLRHGDFLVVN